MIALLLWRFYFPESGQVFINILLLVPCFVLHYKAWMLQRYYGFKKMKPIVQPAQKLFILSCAQAKTGIRIQPEPQLCAYIINNGIVHCCGKCRCIIIVIIHRFSILSRCGKAQRKYGMNIKPAVKFFRPAICIDDIIYKNRRRLMRYFTIERYMAFAYQALWVGKRDACNGTAKPARVNAYNKMPPVVIVIVFCIKLLGNLQHISFFFKGVHNTDAFREHAGKIEFFIKGYYLLR